MSARCLSLTSSQAVDSSEEETDWTEEQTSRESSPGISQVPRRLSPTKRSIVDNVMRDFQRLFNQSLRAHTTGASSSGSSNGPNGCWSSNTSTYSTSSFASRKRSLSGGGSTPPDDDEDESNKRRRPYSKPDSKNGGAELRYACPYYKRNPGRHQTYTSCRDPGFTTVARLKEHLYRRHLLPPQCHRCCTTFSTEVALREHQRDPAGCDVQAQVPLEGFDKDQERRLKSKKKSQNYMTEDEKWKVVYRILFPDDAETDIPTPYIEYQPCTGQVVEPSNVVRFQQFSRLELPRLVRRTLEAVVEQEAQPLEDRLKERLVDIVKECQTQLVSMFQTLDGSNIRPDAQPISSAVAPPTAPPASEPTNDPWASVVERQGGTMFQDFDTSLNNTIRPSLANAAPDFQMTVAMPKHPTSSNSSDSGYDSTWPAGRTPALSTNAETSAHIHTVLPTDEYYAMIPQNDHSTDMYELANFASAPISNAEFDIYSGANDWHFVGPWTDTFDERALQAADNADMVWNR
ncbi:hypothetical protein EK21DRAFT_113413 [Setomelanomma holmii]|uniref:C2H2-type domain-containing protein n=1 Tax=Setomelanomma holmii TaxID=210430 RepID=A0A9P4H931_9PLEO|nr:hypothetical protein EK21DRAFT_113413 [Setomelanomma holmii]